MRQLLKQLVTVNRPTSTRDSEGGISQTFTAVYSDIAASVQPATSSVQFFYAQRQLKVTQTVLVAGTLDLQRGDRITDGTTTYVVIGWRDLSGRGRVTAVDCELFIP